MVSSEKGVEPRACTKTEIDRRVKEMKEIPTEREVNNDILGAELVCYIAFGIGKPGYRGTP